MKKIGVHSMFNLILVFGLYQMKEICGLIIHPFLSPFNPHSGRGVLEPRLLLVGTLGMEKNVAP